MSKVEGKAKRTFSSVFSNRVYGASKASGFPKNINGIIFFASNANSLDPKDPAKAKHYSRAKLGNAFVLSEEKLNKIMSILSEDTEEGKFIGSGLEQK